MRDKVKLYPDIEGIFFGNKRSVWEKSLIPISIQIIEAQLSKLKTARLTDDQVKLAIDPLQSFML
jgi:hypothetical protein